MRVSSFLASALVLLGGAGAVSASSTTSVADVPAPAAVLGRTIGDGAVSHADVVAYLEALAAASDAVTLTDYALSHEGRRLVYATITSPANHRRLDDIRIGHANIADPRSSRGDGAEDALATLPGVAWLSACIHGDEMSGTDALLRLAHRLATGEDAFARQARDELVVHIDPLQNPDGRDRFLAQIRSMTGAVANPDHAALHHAGAWSGGRGNHYRFDLNRDWVPMVHPETRGRAAAILAWNPMLLVDAHEMGSLDTFLFDPPREPIHPAQSPRIRTRRGAFGEAMADAFDAEGWPYYTQEWYEEWYPGYTNAWASLGGAVGILYEQASINGTLIRKPSGRIETYGDSVDHMETAFTANLRSLLAGREAMLRDRLADRRAAVGGPGADDDASLPGGVLLVPPHPDRRRLDWLTDLLVRNGIEIEVAREPVRARAGRTSLGDRFADERSYPAGTLVVRSEQPRRRLLHALCGFDPRMTDDFLLRERRELAAGRGSLLYDVTAWNLPMSGGLPAVWADAVAGGDVVAWSAPRARATGADPEAAPRVGWVVDAADGDLSRLLVRLFDAGMTPRVATRPFTVEGVRHGAGSLLLRRDEHGPDLGARLAGAAKGLTVRLRPVSTGLTSDGVDLGGQRFDVLVPPRIAIATRGPVAPTGFGSIWHALDARLGVRCSPVGVRELGRLDLRRYSVLVLPDGGGYGGALGAGGTRRLREWVAAGGTLIAIGGAADWASNAETQLAGARARTDVLEELDTWLEDIERERSAGAIGVDLDAVWGGTPDAPDAAPPPAPGATVAPPTTATDADANSDAEGDDADADDAEPPAIGTAASLPAGADARRRLETWQRRFAPTGAFVRAEVDGDHWIGFGVDRELPLLVTGSRVLLSRRPTQTPVRLGDASTMRLSGLLWPEGRARLHRASAVTVDRVGRGQVICFASDPVFRGLTEGTRRLLENAVLLGPSLGADAPVPW